MTGECQRCGGPVRKGHRHCDQCLPVVIREAREAARMDREMQRIQARRRP